MAKINDFHFQKLMVVGGGKVGVIKNFTDSLLSRERFLENYIFDRRKKLSSMKD